MAFRSSSESAKPSPSRNFYRMRREAYRGTRPASSNGGAASTAPQDLAQLTEERDRLKDHLLRSRAEMDNYRKRIERDREEMNAQRARQVILSMLPVLDNFERALQASSGSTDAASVIAGVEMIRDQFKQGILGLGVEAVPALGEKFDPTLHEAVAVEPRDDVEDGTVIDVLQEGFKMGERLLRPSMVRVAKKK